MKRLILIFLAIGLILPIFSFAQIKTKQIKEKVPGILENWWVAIKNFFGISKNTFSESIKKAWNEIITIWKKMWNWLISAMEWLWEKIREFFSQWRLARK